jgi:hypothetical protein
LWSYVRTDHSALVFVRCGLPQREGRRRKGEHNIFTKPGARELDSSDSANSETTLYITLTNPIHRWPHVFCSTKMPLAPYPATRNAQDADRRRESTHDPAATRV